MKKLEDFIGKKVTICSCSKGTVNIQSGVLKKENNSWVIREIGNYICFKLDVSYYFSENYYLETGAAYFYLNPEY